MEFDNWSEKKLDNFEQKYLKSLEKLKNSNNFYMLSCKLNWQINLTCKQIILSSIIFFSKNAQLK